MKRFAWRLQKVLDVKSRQEQLKRTELFRITEQLAAKRGELLLRQRVLQDLLDEIKRHEFAQRLGPPNAKGDPKRDTSRLGTQGCVWGPLNAQEFFLRCSTTDDEQIRRLQEDIATLGIRHKEKMAEVLAVRRFKEGLEKLREQAKEQYLREQEKAEQKESEERTVIAFLRHESDLRDPVRSRIGE